MMCFRTIAACALIGMTSLTPVAAATVDVAPEHSSIFGDALGAHKWNIRASYVMGSQSRSKVSAGAFRLIETDTNGAKAKFLGFCLSPFEWLRLPLQYTVGTDLSTKVVNRLSALANGAWSQIANATTAGAFQLAAWEIVSETHGAPLSLLGGDFKVTWSSDATAATLAQTWLNNVQNNTFHAQPQKITILSADNTQDLLTADLPAPVPLPSAAVALLIGLGGLAGFGRKRRCGLAV